MFKKLYTLIGCLGAFSTAFYPGFAYSTCEYKSNTKSAYTHSIQSVKNITHETIDYIEDTRKCTVSMTLLIDSQWYDTKGSYVFGSFLSEEDGCRYAIEKAKKNILTKISPEIISGEDNLNCYSGYRNVSSVDLLPKKVDNKLCKRMYFDVRIKNVLGKVWGYDCR
jgi:hypothetical protein